MSREPYEEILRRNLTRTLQGNAPQHPITPRGLAGQDLCWQRLRGHRQSARNRVTMLCVKEVRAFHSPIISGRGGPRSNLNVILTELSCLRIVTSRAAWPDRARQGQCAHVRRACRAIATPAQLDAPRRRFGGLFAGNRLYA